MKITLDGREVDLGNSVVALTKQVYNLSNLNDRNIAFSNQITLPRTQQNIDIFDHPCFISSTARQYEKYYEAHIIDNTFLFDGVGILKEANDEYKLQIVDKSKEYFTLLDKKINTLDFEDDDIVFSLSAYTNLKTTTLAGDSVWLWSAIACHESRQAKKTIIAPNDGDKLRFSRPSFRATKIRDKLNETTGWTIEGGPPNIENIILSSNAKRFYFTSYQLQLNSTFNVALAGGQFYMNTMGDYDFIVNPPVEVVGQPQIEIGKLPSAATTLPTIFRLRGGIDIDVDFTIIFEATSSSGTDIQFISYNVLSTDKFIDITTPIFKSTDLEYHIKINLIGDGDFTFNNALLYTLTEENDFETFSKNPPNFVGYKVKVHDNLPDYKIIDLARLSWQAGGTFFNVDSFEQKIKQFPLSDLSKLDSIDWSDKFIQGTDVITNNLGGYTRTNELRYDNDDTVSSNLGYDTFTIDNDTLDDISVQIELPFGASNEVEIDNYNMADLAIYDDTGRIAEINNRLFAQYEDVFDGDNISFGIFSPISWTNLKLGGYQDLFTSLNRVRIVTCQMNLKKLDFQSFDFTKPVYIDFFNSYFYVLKISNFIPGKSTTVTLLKFL